MLIVHAKAQFIITAVESFYTIIDGESSDGVKLGRNCGGCGGS